MAEILEQLGVFGIPRDDEDAVLAAMVTGDPALLIGKQGTAKTAMVEAIGACLRERDKRDRPSDRDSWFNYHSYDSSKINFEDLIGLPNPKSMNEGRSEFIGSPTTIWDKTLVSFDEFNRQEPSRQNNIFEVIRSRKLMGNPTAVKFILNCMNPFDMEGTEPLDAALVDRMQWFIYPPDLASLSEADQVRVACHVGNSDAPGLKLWLKQSGEFDISEEEDVTGKVAFNEKLANAGDLLHQILNESAAMYAQLENESVVGYATFVSRYINSLRSSMANKDWNVELSGRRSGMITRALLAFRAVDLVMARVFTHRSPRDLQDLFIAVLQRTIPVGIANATAEGAPADAMAEIANRVSAFGEFFKTGGKCAQSVDIIYELLTTESMARKIELLMGHVTSEATKNFVWADLLSTDKSTKTKEEIMRNSVLLNVVTHMMSVDPDVVPTNFRSIVAKEATNALTNDDIFKNLELKGPIARWAKEIEAEIQGINDPFIKLQAKMIFAHRCAAAGRGDQRS